MPSSLPLVAIHHLSFQVKDVEKTQAFYCQLMGFRPIKRPDLKFPGAWLFRDGLQIHLIGGQDLDRLPGDINSRADHVAFHSVDLETVEQQLIEHGIHYRVNIQTGSGVKQLFFHDPDGHTVEIGTYLPIQEID